MGKKAARAGKTFERRVEAVNGFLMKQSCAYIFKVPDPVKVLRTDKQGKIYGVKDTPQYVDFAGLLADGRFVGFDAKRTESKTSWSFDQLRPFQRWALTMTAAMGGIAFIYLQRWEGARCHEYVLPVDDEGVIAGVTDRKSIPWDRAEPYKIPAGQTWFDVIVEMYP